MVVRERGIAIADEDADARAKPPDSTTRDVLFARLADAHLSRAYRLATVLLGDESEAQDAVQDAAVAAWRSFQGLRDTDLFDAWFDRILVNGCRDRLRKRAHVRFVPIEAAPEQPATDGSIAIAEHDALESALNGLTAEQRIVVVLRYFEDLSIDQIAERTRERNGTVKSRLHYGLLALRAAYDAAARPDAEA